MNEVEIKRSFFAWMKTKSPEWLDYFGLYLAAPWVTEKGLQPKSESDLWDIDELTADVNWEYIEGVCHEQKQI